MRASPLLYAIGGHQSTHLIFLRVRLGERLATLSPMS